MAKSYDVKKNQGEIKEIQKKLEIKKSESSSLEKHKQELLDAMTDVQGAKLDEKTVETVKEAINAALEANSEKGQELSEQMNEDIKSMENMKQETMESMSDAQKQKESIQRKKKLLDKFDQGGNLESAEKSLDANMQELSDINNELIETMRESMKVAQKLSGY